MSASDSNDTKLAEALAECERLREENRQLRCRLHRLHENKHEVMVYDYLNTAEPVLSKMYSKRVRGQGIGGRIGCPKAP